MNAFAATRLLAAENLTRAFPVRRGLAALLSGGRTPAVRALNGVSFAIAASETLAVVGESGCGKSTLARALVRLIGLDAGRIIFDGEEVVALTGAALRRYHRRAQLVFQDPYSSLNPRMTVGETLAEALTVHRMVPPAGRAARVAELLGEVGLPAAAAARLPHALSGGQRQRVALARALSVRPEILVADEIVSALDVSVQAQIVNLLIDLQERLGLAILFISHDLRIVRHIAHRVIVMYLGRIVESGPADAIFAEPVHPYTAALLRAVPQIGAGRSRAIALGGELQSPLDLPSGCAFHPRCPHAMPRCRTERPELRPTASGRRAACHLSG